MLNGWVKPAGFAVSIAAILVTIARWSSSIEGKLNMLSWQMENSNQRIEEASKKLDTKAEIMESSSAESHQTAKIVRSQQKILDKMTINVDSLTWRVRQIEEKLHMYHN